MALRINHACSLNFQNTGNKEFQKLTIHAARDNSEKEEISICYIGRDPTVLNGRRNSH